ncbi:MAG: hypothetical protein ACFB50_16975, partial [Rubrobacteraceae bacterium]
RAICNFFRYWFLFPSDGKFVAAGVAHTGSGFEFAVARYNSDGTPEPNFGTNGIVTTDVGGNGDSAAEDVALRPDGKIVAAGFANAGSDREFAVARYNADGTLDTTFGTNGTVTTDVGTGNSGAGGVALQEDGKIVAAGSAFTGSGDEFAVVRYNAVGTLDTTFGTNGTVTTDVGGNGDSFARDLALQEDGKIVAAGGARTSSGREFAVARYEVDPAPPPRDRANLSLTKKASKGRPTVGQKLTYTLRVKNNGPDRATSVKIVDTLPKGVKVLSTSKGCKKLSARKVRCNIARLADSRSVSKKIVVKVNRKGKLVNRARASSSVRDPNPKNNSARAVVRAKPKPRKAPRFKQISCKVKNPTVRLVQGKQVVVADSKPGASTACVVQGNQLALARALKNRNLGLVKQGGKQVRAAKGKVVNSGARRVVVRVPRGF